MSKIFNKIIFLSVIFTLFLPLTTTAQIVPKLEDVLLLNLTPTYPEPGDIVNVSVESFSVDLNNSTISWFVNEILEQQSIGATSFQFIAGELGSSANISVVANINNDYLETEQVTIRPTEADIIWQGNTFTHPMYKGKHIPSVGSTINIEVVPHFLNELKHRLDVKDLTYSWRIDGKALLNASGRGENTITISQIKPVKSIQIEVEIQSPDNLLSRKERLSIPIQDSELLVYENNPLFGTLFNKAINAMYKLTEQETKFIAYPFFMSILDRNSNNVDFSWKLNNNPIVLEEDKSSIIVSHIGDNGGKAKITAVAQNTRDIFQKSKKDFIIEFGKDTTSGFRF